MIHLPYPVLRAKSHGPPKEVAKFCPECGESMSGAKTVYWCKTCEHEVCEGCRLENHRRHRLWLRDPAGRWLPVTFDYDEFRRRGVRDVF